MRLLWALVGAILGLNAAQAANNTAVVMGLGMDSCSDVTKAFKSNSFSEPTYLHWAQGFLSGRNLDPTLAGQPVKDLLSISSDSQRLLIRVYCNEHPNEPYIRAVSSVWDQLKSVPQK